MGYRSQSLHPSRLAIRFTNDSELPVESTFLCDDLFIVVEVQHLPVVGMDQFGPAHPIFGIALIDSQNLIEHFCACPLSGDKVFLIGTNGSSALGVPEKQFTLL